MFARSACGPLVHAFAVLIIMLSLGGVAQSGPFTAEFTPLGSPGTESAALGISGDGGAVVGWGRDGAFRAVRWPEANGWQPQVASFEGHGEDASHDGRVVVGIGELGTQYDYEAFRWTQGAGVEGLGALPGHEGSVGRGVSADGAVVVGNSESDSAPFRRAFRWTEATGMQDLGTHPGGEAHGYEATGISADGSTIVGDSLSHEENRWQGFLWTEASGMQTLAPLSGYGDSFVLGISADGESIVGSSGRRIDGGYVTQAVRWTRDGNVQSLGTPSTFDSTDALKSSADGSVIIGVGTIDGMATGFLYTEATGIQQFDQLLMDAGVDLTGWRLHFPQDISDDGRTIVGYGRNPAGDTEAWLVRLTQIPEPSTLLLASLAGLLFCTSRRRV